jgi:hypothetical protein
VKLKLKLNKRYLVIAVVAVLALWAVLVGRGGDGDVQAAPLDAAADRACSDFAAGYPRARTEAGRLSLADKVAASSARTGNDGIADRAAQVGRSADESAAEWRSSADALLEACRAAGWSG